MSSIRNWARAFIITSLGAMMGGCVATGRGAENTTAIASAPASAGLRIEGPWRFQHDPSQQGEALGWAAPGFDDSAWSIVNVPGEWGPRELDGHGWYRTSVDMPPSVAGQKDLKLVFRQVDDGGVAYLNGAPAGEHHSWNTPFIVDIDPVLVAGGGRLHIALRVEDKGGAGGILQPVELVSGTDPRTLYATDWSSHTAPRPLDHTGSMVIYSIMVRNYTPKGTFDAMRERLPEIQALGANTIWLIPIHPIGVEERKGPDGSPYAIRDYYDVDPALGTKEDFREFVDAAHARHMRVMMDCVMRHTAHDSVWAKERPDWFLRDENGKPRPGVPEWQDIVDLDWNNKEVWEATAQVLEYWVREYGVDGYRADVADAMPAEWWTMVRQRLERIKPDVVMLAESEDAANYFRGFDLTYCQSLRDTTLEIAAGTADATDLKTDVLSRYHGYPNGATQMLFVENQDKPRAMTAYGGPAPTKAASVLTATLPGVPLLYTGTEVGATADRDEGFFKRVPVDFTHDPHNMRAFWSDLLRIRAAHTALRFGDLAVVDAQPAKSVFAFERKAGDDRVLVVLNLGHAPVTAAVDHPWWSAAGTPLAPWEWRILEHKP